MKTNNNKKQVSTYVKMFQEKLKQEDDLKSNSNTIYNKKENNNIQNHKNKEINDNSVIKAKKGINFDELSDWDSPILNNTNKDNNLIQNQISNPIENNIINIDDVYNNNNLNENQQFNNNIILDLKNNDDDNEQISIRKMQNLNLNINKSNPYMNNINNLNKDNNNFNNNQNNNYNNLDNLSLNTSNFTYQQNELNNYDKIDLSIATNNDYNIIGPGKKVPSVFNENLVSQIKKEEPINKFNHVIKEEEDEYSKYEKDSLSDDIDINAPKDIMNQAEKENNISQQQLNDLANDANLINNFYDNTNNKTGKFGSSKNKDDIKKKNDNLKNNNNYTYDNYKKSNLNKNVIKQENKISKGEIDMTSPIKIINVNQNEILNNFQTFQKETEINNNNMNNIAEATFKPNQFEKINSNLTNYIPNNKNNDEINKNNINSLTFNPNKNQSQNINSQNINPQIINNQNINPQNINNQSINPQNINNQNINSQNINLNPQISENLNNIYYPIPNNIYPQITFPQQYISPYPYSMPFNFPNQVPIQNPNQYNMHNINYNISNNNFINPIQEEKLETKKKVNKSVNYKPKSLKEYKEKYVNDKGINKKRGGLGPNIGTKEWEEKEKVKNRMKEYSEKIKEKNEEKENKIRNQLKINKENSEIIKDQLYDSLSEKDEINENINMNNNIKNERRIKSASSNKINLNNKNNRIFKTIGTRK